MSPSSLRVAAGVGFGARFRRSAQTSRCAPIMIRSTLLVANRRSGIPTSSAYQRADELAADATEFEIRPASPSDFAAFSGEVEPKSVDEAEAADEHERERQRPEEEPVGERAGDDAAADLGVAVDDVEDRVDRGVARALELRALGEPLGLAPLERLLPGPRPLAPARRLRSPSLGRHAGGALRRRRRLARSAPFRRARQPTSSSWTAAAPTSGPSGTGRSHRREDERARLRAAEAAVEGDQLLEGAGVLEGRVVEAAHEEVRDVRNESLRSRCAGALAPKGASGSSPSTRPVASSREPRGAEHERPALRRADEQPADVRMARGAP